MSKKCQYPKCAIILLVNVTLELKIGTLCYHFSEISKIEDSSLYGLKLVLQIFDYCTLTVFILEIILKWIDGFWSFWKNGWNIFDFIVTVMVCMSTNCNISVIVINLQLKRMNESDLHSIPLYLKISFHILCSSLYIF